MIIKKEGIPYAVICDWCDKFYPVDDNAIITSNDYRHVCIDCAITCTKCQQKFSPYYVKNYFKQSLCENCQEDS